ncbi:MAG TPA: hypothetical protein VGD65_18405 [Chryseosolibacter sp.]
MINKTEFFFATRSFIALIGLTLMFSACKKDDPKPVNEEEVITTLNVVLTPSGGGIPVTLKFQDQDGDGSVAPVKTVSGPLNANKTYTGVITLQDESRAVVKDITPEVEEEAEDHLFCFAVTGSNLTVAAADTDANSLPIGLTSNWVTTTAGNASIKITLRHQPGTKTGTCPGTGETDVEVDFSLTIQ